MFPRMNRDHKCRSAYHTQQPSINAAGLTEFTLRRGADIYQVLAVCARPKLNTPHMFSYLSLSTTRIEGMLALPTLRMKKLRLRLRGE